MNFCKDCRHMRINQESLTCNCMASTYTVICPVLGELEYESACSLVRMDSPDNRNYPNCTLFEDKEEE